MHSMQITFLYVEFGLEMDQIINNAVCRLSI